MDMLPTDATYLAVNNLRRLQCLAIRETVRVRYSVLPNCKVLVRTQPTGPVYPNNFVLFGCVHCFVWRWPPMHVRVVLETEMIAALFAFAHSW